MDDTLVVAVLALAGTLVGTFGGILTANKLSNYRIEQLEKKVDKHNHLIERMTIVERDVKTAFNLLDEVRDDLKNKEDRK